MRNAVAEVMEAAGLGLAVAGVYLLAGVGAALVVGGVLLALEGFRVGA